MVLTAAALATLSVGARVPQPVLIFNATASAPVGFYALADQGANDRGNLVLARLPPFVRGLAARRGYLPEQIGLVKRVAAVSGDRVCSTGATVTINHRPMAKVLAVDSQGRTLPHWKGCLVLRANEVFLAMPDVSTSFDGRYFGPIDRSAILGRLTPLCTW
jgi:conjugative transfer signal peptidase TraF